jgi:UDP-N-acetylmuramoyl-tripeptide--D-alanyl-D-alanine ligase
MIPMSLVEIASVVGGEAVNDGDGAVVVDGPAFVDSRVAERGGLFVAVVGEHVDGHDYAASAVEQGATAVLSSRDTGLPGVVVTDPVPALAELARHVLAQLPDVTVLALTGSQGKTSTKDVLAQVLASAGRTVATFGSFNNELGLPLTVLRTDSGTDYLLLEMGARHVGDIAASCRIAPPDVAVVLNVGKAHIGEFGSQEAIARAKGEIVEALSADGTAVLNADDPLVAGMAGRTAARVVTFGQGPHADVRFDDVTLDDHGRPHFVLGAAERQARIALQLVGEHHAGNAAAVTAAALAARVPFDTVVTALGEATATSPARMQVTERPDGVTIVNDAYNANPDSMRAALKALVAIGRSRAAARAGSRTVAVLGEMLELGASSRDEHDAVGRLAVRLDIGQLLVVGDGAKPMHLGASLEGSWGGESVFVPDTHAARAWLREHLRTGDVVLFKASRDAGLRQLAEAVLMDSHDDRAGTDEAVAASGEEIGR